MCGGGEEVCVQGGVCVLFTCMASLLIKRRSLLPGSHSRHAACRTRPQAEPHPDQKTEASRALQ